MLWDVTFYVSFYYRVFIHVIIFHNNTVLYYYVLSRLFHRLLAVIFLAGFICSRLESGALRVWDHWLPASVRPAALSTPSGRPSVSHPAALHQPEHTHRTQDQVCSLRLHQSVQSCSILFFFFLPHMSFIWKLFLQLPSQFEWVCKIMHSAVLLMIKHLSIYL